MQAKPEIHNNSDNPGSGPTRFWQTFLALLALGMLGVLSLIPTMIDQLSALGPEFPDLPQPLVVVISLINPALLLAVAVAVGTLTAHRVGLRSLVAERVRQGQPVWPRLRPHLLLGIAAGLAFAVVTAILEVLLNPFANAVWLDQAPAEGNPLMQLFVGLLYGGITEELLLRWGFMSLLVWGGWRLFQRGQGLPRTLLVWVAILLAALLFGIGHLPAMSGLVVMTPLIIFRTIFLNALGGVIFGWLYWRRSLEVAMLAHAVTHVGFFLLNSVAGLLQS